MKRGAEWQKGDILVDSVRPFTTNHDTPAVHRVIRSARPITRNRGTRRMRLGVGVAKGQVRVLVQHTLRVSSSSSPVRLRDTAFPPWNRKLGHLDMLYTVLP